MIFFLGQFFCDAVKKSRVIQRNVQGFFWQHTYCATLMQVLRALKTCFYCTTHVMNIMMDSMANKGGLLCLPNTTVQL